MAMSASAWRTAIGLGMVVVLLATWESMSLILKGMETTYHQSFFISYVVRSSYVVCLPIWWILKTATGRTRDALPRWDGHLFIFIASFVSIWGIFSWYVSLEMTDIAFNNAIYQTTAVFVYLLSIPLLKMKVTAYGISALVLALGGLALVTMFSPSDGTPQACTRFNSSMWGPGDIALANMTVPAVANATSCCELCERYSANATTTCVSWMFDATQALCRVSGLNVTVEPAPSAAFTAGQLVPAVSSSSALGYILCLISVIAYAVFEVTYKMFEHLMQPPHKRKAGQSHGHGHDGGGARATTVGREDQKLLGYADDDAASSSSEADADGRGRGRGAVHLAQIRAPPPTAEKADASINAPLIGGGVDGDEDGGSAPMTAVPAAGAEAQAGAGAGAGAGGAPAKKLDVLTPVLDCLKFLGLMGVYTLVSVPLCVWMLDATKVELFVNPFMLCGGGISCFVYMLVDGALDMAYNICLLVGISLTSPRFMSAGTIMIIPVGVAVDAIQYPDMVWSPWAILGAAIIISSFFVMEFLETIVNATCNKKTHINSSTSTHAAAESGKHELARSSV